MENSESGNQQNSFGKSSRGGFGGSNRGGMSGKFDISLFTCFYAVVRN